MSISAFVPQALCLSPLHFWTSYDKDARKLEMMLRIKSYCSEIQQKN